MTVYQTPALSLSTILCAASELSAFPGYRKSVGRRSVDRAIVRNDATYVFRTVGTAGFYPWFGFGLIMLVKIGTSVKVSQAAGRNDMEEVQKIGNNGILFMLGLAMLYSFVGFFGADFYVALFKGTQYLDRRHLFIQM